MKSTGIVRRVDPLGRIVIPREIIKAFGIKLNETSMEIYTEGDQIILKKYQPGCSCCSNITDLIIVNGISLCPSCLNQFIMTNNNLVLTKHSHD